MKKNKEYLIAKEITSDIHYDDAVTAKDFQNDEETMIWRLTDIQNQFYAIKDVELIFKSTGSLTVNFTFISNRTRSYRTHPPIIITIFDINKIEILKWDTGRWAYGCDTNVRNSKIKTGLNIYDRAIKCFFSVGSYTYFPC